MSAQSKLLGGICVGCGACAAVCRRNALTVCTAWDGSLVVARAEPPAECNGCSTCLKVCPFEPLPVTAEGAGSSVDRFGAQLGEADCRFLAGWATRDADRQSSASGGLASAFAAHALRDGLVERVFAVAASMTGRDGGKFAYQSFVSALQLDRARGSVYGQVSVEGALREASTQPGRSAFTALPCVARAIRRAAPVLGLHGERAPLIIGLVCGQNKSRLFSDFVARFAGVRGSDYEMRYRVKTPGVPASDYRVSATSSAESGAVRFSEIRSVWSSGAFTPEACLNCGDLFCTEADVVFMDAWAPQFRQDCSGVSYCIAKTAESRNLMDQLADTGHVVIHEVAADAILSSQSGSLARKTHGLRYRQEVCGDQRFLSPSFAHLPRLVQRLKYRTVWRISRNSPNVWRMVRGSTWAFMLWLCLMWGPVRALELLVQVLRGLRLTEGGQSNAFLG